MSKPKKKQLSDTPMIGVRLGELRPRVEAACKRLGIDISEFVRRAVEQDLTSYRGTLAPRAIYWSVATYFLQLARALADLGIISRDSFLELQRAIATTNKQVRANFEKKDWLEAVARFGDFPDLAQAERVLSQHAWESPTGGTPVESEAELAEVESMKRPPSPFPPREDRRNKTALPKDGGHKK